MYLINKLDLPASHIIFCKNRNWTPDLDELSKDSRLLQLQDTLELLVSVL